jgi:uncharacterized protein (TIGR03118 family)
MQSRRVVPFALAVIALLAINTSTFAHSGGTTVREVDLVSDLPGRAAHTDANLVNPWGILRLPDGTFRVSDADAGVSTAYKADGTATGDVITIPGGGPTGVTLDASWLSSENRCWGRRGTSKLIFVSEEGTLSTWSPGTGSSAVTVQTIKGASYKGVAVGGGLIYAANFLAGTVDVFDHTFTKLDWSGTFQDPSLPADFAPWNILNHDGRLYVAYAKHEPGVADEVTGAGLGYINVFDLRGNLLHRVVSAGSLNAPWGLAFAPEGSGKLEGALLVGNFGDGRINVFNPRSGDWIGALSDASGNPVSISGLWGIAFGSGDWRERKGHNGRADDEDDDDGRPALYFAAGIEEEAHGLFGVLRFENTRNDRGHGNDRDAAIANPTAEVATAAVEPGVSMATGNPINASSHSNVEFGVVVGQPSRLSFGIYDVGGRCVAQPFRGEEVSGSVRVSWNRRDQAGSTVPNGVYFYRATIGTVTQVGRFVIVP